MIISPGRRLVFVHIPKTGGTSMALALEDRAQRDDILIGDTPKAKRRRARVQKLKAQGRLWKHSTLEDIEGVLTTAQLHDYFVFTLVRNPWARMVSYYHWLRHQSFDHPAVSLAKEHGFTGFLQTELIQTSFRNSPATSYVSRGDQLLCNAFVRLEHLDRDLDPVADHLGFDPRPIPLANSAHQQIDWRSVYTDDTAAIVSDICAADIVRFGYRFDP